MKSIQKTRAEAGAEVVSLPVPKAGPHDLVVRVKAAAMCKSDVEVFEWTPLVQAAGYPLPFTLGHEFAGEVVETGELVRGFAPGDRVAGETHIPCGRCRECRTDKQHICSGGMGVLGRNVDGCFAGYIRLPEISAIKLRPDADYMESSLYEPLGTAIHALQKAEPCGKKIAILGTGTIGLMACEAAKAMGAVQVIALDISPSRLEYAKKMGADVTVNGKEQDFVAEVRRHTDQLDAVVDFTGSNHVLNQAVDALSIGGRLVHVGMVADALTIPGYMYRVVYRELQITGIYGRHMYKTWELLGNLLESGGVKLEHYVGETMPMEQYERALERFDLLNGRAILIPGEDWA